MRPKNLRDGDMDIRAPDKRYTPNSILPREQWAELRNDTPMTLEPGEFSQLRSMHDRLDLKEVEEIYLPLSRLLSIYVDAAQRLYYAQRQFLGIRDRKVPYVIGIAGSAAVGKSTTARVLQGAARTMVAAAQSRSGDDRWLSLSQSGAGARRADAEEGISGELRSGAVVVVPERHQSRTKPGAGAGLFAFDLRHRPEPVAGGRPARHPYCRGRECPADRPVAAPRQGSARRLRLFRLLPLHRRGRVGAARLVRAALSDLPRHRVPQSKILLPPLFAAVGR